MRCELAEVVDLTAMLPTLLYLLCGLEFVCGLYFVHDAAWWTPVAVSVGQEVCCGCVSFWQEEGRSVHSSYLKQKHVRNE